jgi:hypothetical protein
MVNLGKFVPRIVYDMATILLIGAASAGIIALVIYGIVFFK